MLREFIFVTGIHGVGKTSRCKRICEEFKFIYLNAGELIKSGKDIKNLDNDKRVSDVESNQDILLNGIDKYTSERRLLLDGHLTLMGYRGGIERVPIQFLRKLNPTILILLINAPEVVVENLKMRDSRDYDIDLIKFQQQTELEYAKQVAKELNIPIMEFNSYDEVTIVSSLRERLQYN